MRHRTPFRVVAPVLLLLVAGCAHDIPDLPPAPTTVPGQTATTTPDLTGIALRSVNGRPSGNVVIRGGQASITGSVNGPTGPVPLATVHLERLVGDDVGVLDVATGPDGVFSLPGIRGGRYRIRAYRAPDMAMIKPSLFFLGGDEPKQMNLPVDRYDGLAVSSALAPSTPVVGEPANLVVQVTQSSVDAKGVVRGVPVPAARAELFATGDWRVDGVNAQLTDAGGRGHWQVRCGSPGAQPLSVVVGDTGNFPLSIAPCVLAPPTTTTSAVESGSTTTSTVVPTPSSTSSTTTTPGPRRTTTTTTA